MRNDLNENSRWQKERQKKIRKKKRKNESEMKNSSTEPDSRVLWLSTDKPAIWHINKTQNDKQKDYRY